MHTHLLATKFHIPPGRAAEVSRPRLLEQLHAGLREGRKLTLVSAPAGYGKTTLVAEWVHTLDTGTRAVVWLSLDPADNQPERFFAYFLAAFDRMHQEVRPQVEHLFSLPKLPPSGALLDDLINLLAEVDTPVLLVLDDYHVLSNPVIHEGMQYFLDHQPHSVHLVITTRQDPPLPLPRLRARRQMTEIRARDLRFTPVETGQFFSHAMQLDLAEEAARLLEERTEGWAVGLQLAGLALQNITDPEHFLQTFRGSHRYVLDYLAEEVVAQQGEATRLFLSQTSVVEQFNADLCCALTGEPDAQAVIDRLEKANLFIVPLDDVRTWYRYHHLFRDYLTSLQTKAEQTALCRKASTWHEANAMVPEAVRYALASGDSDFAAGVIERAVSKNTTWSGGNVVMLSSWLAALPEDVLWERPGLSLNASRIFYLASQLDLAEKHIAQAEKAIKILPLEAETEQLQATAALYRGSIACARGDMQQATERTLYALARLPADNHLLQARAYFNLGEADEVGGRMEGAVKNFLRSSDEALLAGVQYLAIQAKCSAAQVQVEQGDLDLAEQTCNEVIHSQDGMRIPPLGLAYIVLGIIAIERNDLVSADPLLVDGVALSRQGGLMENAVLGFASLARLHVYRGNLAGALDVLQEARAVVQTHDVSRIAPQMAAYLARFQLFSGQKQEAARWAAGYQANRTNSASAYEDFTLARILIATEQTEAVAALLHPIFERAAQAGRCHTCIQAALLLSLSYDATNQPNLAVHWLSQALDLAAPRGYVRLFIDEGKPLLNLLRKVRSTAPEFVDQLLKTMEQEPEIVLTANDRLPEPLSEQEQRVLDLIVRGKSNQEIAELLFISVGTAKWHVHNILQKLGVNNRPKAIALARELGLN